MVTFNWYCISIGSFDSSALSEFGIFRQWDFVMLTIIDLVEITIIDLVEITIKFFLCRLRTRMYTWMFMMWHLTFVFNAWLYRCLSISLISQPLYMWNFNMTPYSSLTNQCVCKKCWCTIKVYIIIRPWSTLGLDRQQWWDSCII